MTDAFAYRGLPRTSDEWAALARIASGQFNITREQLRELFMLGLVERQLGRICLSRHGRSTLGLAESPPPVEARRQHGADRRNL